MLSIIKKRVYGPSKLEDPYLSFRLRGGFHLSSLAYFSNAYLNA